MEAVYAIINDCLPQLKESMQISRPQWGGVVSVLDLIDGLSKLGVELADSEIEPLLDRLGAAGEVRTAARSQSAPLHASTFSPSAAQ
eukprot:4709592-Prymnesium_polylepis.1